MSALDGLTKGVGAAARRIRVGQLGSVADVPFSLKVLTEAGVVAPMAPQKLLRVGGALRRWGASPAAGVAAAAIQHPDAIGLIDEAGELTFGELERRSNALARALDDEGVRGGDAVAVMCRNHRGFVDSIFACSKLGATVLLMNTDFAGPQLHGVLEREQPQAIIYDYEFQGLLDGAEDDAPKISRFVAWTDEGDDPAERTIDGAIEASSDDPLDPPDETSRFIVLTSGTTRHPEGRAAQLAGIARAARRAAFQDPAEEQPDDGDRDPHVPLVGLHALHARAGARLDQRAAPPLRPRRGR